MSQIHLHLCLFVLSVICSAVGLNITVNHTEALGLVVVLAPVQQSLSGLLTGKDNSQHYCTRLEVKGHTGG